MWGLFLRLSSKSTLKTRKRGSKFIVILEVQKLVEGLGEEANPGLSCCEAPAQTTVPQSRFVSATYSKALGSQMNNCQH